MCAGDTFNFNGQQLMQADVYSDTLVASSGCDSVVLLTLSVHPLPQPTVFQNGNTLSTGTFNSYQWLLNNAEINGEYNATYTAFASGNYSVVVSDANGCTDTSSVFVFTISDIEETETWFATLYPNPNTGTFVLKHNYYSELNIEVIDVMGRKVAKWQHVATVQNIDLSELAKGIYQLRIGVDNETQKILRLIKE
jgi:hypothetical protein